MLEFLWQKKSALLGTIPITFEKLLAYLNEWPRSASELKFVKSSIIRRQQLRERPPKSLDQTANLTSHSSPTLKMTISKKTWSASCPSGSSHQRHGKGFMKSTTGPVTVSRIWLAGTSLPRCGQYSRSSAATRAREYSVFSLESHCAFWVLGHEQKVADRWEGVYSTMHSG